MRTITKLILILLFFFSFQMSFSQPWMNKVTSEKPTFKEIQTAFYDYWKDRPIEKGQGYKPFKRWEWYWESRLLPNGNFPSPSITWDEFHKYYSQSNTYEQRNTQSTANWTSSGPSSSPGGIGGLGRINCMAFHPTDPNTFWVGTPAGGLWKTTNGGTNWTTNTDNLPVLGVSDIAVHPTNPNILYIATGDGDLGSLSGLTGGADGDTKSVGILKSTDGGATWSTTGLNWNVTDRKLIRRLLINPINPQILIAAASDGIWRTIDGGTNWTPLQIGYHFMDLEYKPGDPTIVYATTYNNNGNAKIFRSTDSGSTWNLISTLVDVGRINLAVTPNAPDLVDALCSNISQGLSGLWYSSNSGASFSQYFVSTNSNNYLHGSYNASGAGGQGYYDLAYAINPNNYNDIWLGGINTWNSTNGGSNWFIKNFWANTTIQNPNNVPVVHADKHFIAFHPLVPGTMFECNDGGLYKTTNNGSTWTDLTNGMQISQMYRIGVSQSQSNSGVICGLQDNGIKIKTTNWADVPIGGDGMECLVDGATSTAFASHQYGKFFRLDLAITDISTNIPLLTVEKNSEGKPNGSWVTPLIMHPSNTSTLYAGYKRVYKTTNKGDTWTAISSGILDSNNEDIRFMAIAPSNPNIIYASTLRKLFATTNGGTSWSQISTLTITDNYANISNIAVDPSNPDKVFITVSGYSAGNKVWMRPSIGGTWINYSGNLPNVPVNCIVYQNGSNEGLYVGTDIGVFYTDGTMNTWIPYQTGLPNVVVTDLEISYYDNKLWAGTFGRGLWNTNLYVPLSVSEQEIYNQIIVSPNPNNGLFSINMPLGKTYSLIVYDIQGKKIYEEKFINTEQKSIDLTKNSSGIYLLNFTIDGKSFNKKIIKY
jgi:photosystem II stability/assembly factor-like uncharacterized protein